MNNEDHFIFMKSYLVMIILIASAFLFLSSNFAKLMI